MVRPAKSAMGQTKTSLEVLVGLDKHHSSVDRWVYLAVTH